MFIEKASWQSGTYRGHTANNFPHGIGEFVWTTGSRFHGYFHNGFIRGPGVFYYSDGIADSGIFMGYIHDMPINASYNDGIRWNASRTRAWRIFEGNEIEELPVMDAHKLTIQMGLSIPKAWCHQNSSVRVHLCDFDSVSHLTRHNFIDRSSPLSFDSFIKFITEY
tara:strand:+ start:321 stop:818 length:498 start_codon:yes stop_codon:yes gene_type:complete